MTRLALLAVLLAGVASANDAFFQAEVVDAKVVAKSPAGPLDPAWGPVAAKRFRLTPQRSVRLHDRKANALLAQPGSSEVEVKAMATTTELSLLLVWADPAREVVRDDEVNVFADSVAVESPVRFGPGLRLPAVSMGDDEMPVHLWMLRALKSGALKSEFAAAGFGSSTRQAPAITSSALFYDEKKKGWRAVLTLPLEAGTPGLVPVAFATWDGARHERSGYKRLSSWHFVRVPGRTVDPRWVEALAFGYFPGDLGEAKRGQPLAEGVCVACHHLPGKAYAPAGLAPSLEGIGAITTPAYLRESIIAPSAVVLHAPNPNQHYSPAGPKDANGAFPNAEAFQWAVQGPEGKAVSKMPAFTGFTAEQLADLLAFLKTLDGPPLEKP